MNAPLFLTWLAGTLLPLGAVWLVYRVALRGERCFGYNRALLLLAPVVAAAWPLLPRPEVPLWLIMPTIAAGETSASVLLPARPVGPAAAPGAGWSAWPWLGLLYLTGVALGLAWQAAQLRSLARQLPREERPGYVLAYTGGQLPVSSFGRVIFWDETAVLAPAEAAATLAHEEAHVRQRHTLDRLWLEVWRAVLWPNPFSHLLLPGLRLTHELLADRAAAAGAPDAEATPYPTLLARLAARQLRGPAYASLLQPFTFSFTLTRIAMLQNQIPVRRWKQWLVLPVLSAVYIAAGHSASAQAAPTTAEASQKARQERINRKMHEAFRQDSLRTGGKFEPGTVQQFNIANMNGPGEPVVTVTRVKASNQPPAPPTQVVEGREQKIYTYVEQMPQLPGGGGQRAIVEAIQRSIVYPQAAGNIPADGRVFVQFVVDAGGTVHGATIIKGLTSAFDEAVLAAVRQLPRFTPGKQNGKEVAVSFTVPVQFKAKP